MLVPPATSNSNSIWCRGNIHPTLRVRPCIQTDNVCALQQKPECESQPIEFRLMRSASFTSSRPSLCKLHAHDPKRPRHEIEQPLQLMPLNLKRTLKFALRDDHYCRHVILLLVLASRRKIWAASKLLSYSQSYSAPTSRSLWQFRHRANTYLTPFRISEQL